MKSAQWAVALLLGTCVASPLAAQAKGAAPPIAAEAALLRTMRFGAPVTSLAFSPDGRLLATRDFSVWTGMVVKVWDVRSGRLAWRSDANIRRWSVAGAIACPLVGYFGDKMKPEGLLYCPIALAAIFPGWFENSPSPPSLFEQAVSFSPDGRSLTINVGNGAEVRDVSTGRRLRGSVATPFGATDCGDPSGRRSRTASPRDGARCGTVLQSPDGLHVASVSGSDVQLSIRWDADVLAESPELARALAPRDPFESSDEFARRISGARDDYQRRAYARLDAEAIARARRIAGSRRRVTLGAEYVALGTYDADRGLLPVSVGSVGETLSLTSAEARALFEFRTEIVVEAVEELAADLQQTQRLNFQLVHPTTSRRYPIGYQVPLADVAATATRPAVLEITSPRFTDADGNSRLDAGERAVLEFTVRNAGEGPGQGLRVEGSGSSAIAGLSAAIGRIEPGESKPVTLTLVGGDSLRDGTAELQFEVREANGFHSQPLAVSVPTRAYRPPVLQVAEVGVADAQGRAVIRTGQVVTLTLRVRNVGEGRATAVVADVVPGAGVSLAETADPRRAVLRVGDLEAGAFRDLRVQAFANAEVRGRFPVSVALREGTGRFAAAARDLGLTLETPQRSVAQLEVSARESAPVGPAGAAAAPRLVSDLLERIPAARRENPNAVAVIIGNRSYQSAPSVAFAANDAAVMRQYAERTLGIKPGNVLYLEDATLTNLQVVFGREGNAEGRLKDLVRPGETEVFVFYSGHGAPDVRGQKAYLMPVDADASRLALTGFSVDALYANLAALGARHVTVVLDACFSGATGGGEMLITEASPIGIQVTNPAARFAGGGATIFAAAQGQQLANWYPEQRHGLFTYFFLKGLQGSADANADGGVTVDEMRTWLTAPTGGVPEASRRLYGTNREQVPQVWGDGARRIR